MRNHRPMTVESAHMPVDVAPWLAWLCSAAASPVIDLLARSSCATHERRSSNMNNRMMNLRLAAAILPLAATLTFSGTGSAQVADWPGVFDPTVAHHPNIQTVLPDCFTPDPSTWPLVQQDTTFLYEDPGQLTQLFRFPVHGMPLFISVPADCSIAVGQVLAVEIAQAFM